MCIPVVVLLPLVGAAHRGQQGQGRHATEELQERRIEKRKTLFAFLFNVFERLRENSFSSVAPSLFSSCGGVGRRAAKSAEDAAQLKTAWDFCDQQE